MVPTTRNLTAPPTPSVKDRDQTELTKDTPYLALTGKLWGVFCEYFEWKWSRYKWNEMLGFNYFFSLNINIFCITGPLWGEPLVKGGFPSQSQWHGALMFSLMCAKQLSKQSIRQWFGMTLCSLWRYSDVYFARLNRSKHSQRQLEQLERLRSEDTPRRLMINHTIESYWIPSQKKTKSNFQIFEFWNGHYTRHTFWSCLIRCANMKWIRWVFLKIQSGHDSVHRQTDGQTDGRTDGPTDKVIPVYPPINFVEAGGIMKWMCETYSHLGPECYKRFDSIIQ